MHGAMSMSKQHERIGAKFVERKETARKLDRIREALDEMRDVFRSTADAIDNRHETNSSVDAELPTAQQVVQLIVEEGEEIDRLRALDEYLAKV